MRKGQKHTEETKRMDHPSTEFKKGHSVSEATKEKIRFSKLGNKNPMFGQHPQNTFKKGHIVSEEHKKKLSLVHKGKPLTAEHKEHLRLVNIGRHLSEETKNKISKAHKGKILTEEHKMKIGRAGEQHNNWQGGKSFEPYGIEFNKGIKKLVKANYLYRCQECFKLEKELFNKKGKNIKLSIHHIDFNKNNNSLDNLIPLCLSCHMKTNYNRENWIEYFQGRIIR